LLYIGYIYAGSTARLAVWLFAGLAIDNIASIKGVADCAGPLWTVLAVLMVWFKIFLAFNYLARALIWWKF